MEYRYDDRALDAGTFPALVQQVWPGEYDAEKTRAALARTINITAWDGGRLAGCLRILTDGCYFGTITELLVLPACRRQGVGRAFFAFAEELARQRGLSALRIDTYRLNLRMQALILSRGFTKVGEIRLHGRPLPYPCFEKALN